MKNLLLLLTVSTFFLVSCNDDDTKSNDSAGKDEMQISMQQFLKSVEIVPKGRIAVNEKQSARIFTLNIYDKTYEPLQAYSLDGEVFLDDGSVYDEVANDGIYTSTQPKNQSAMILKENIVFRSDEFETSLAKKGGVEINCKVGWTRKGKSLLGDSCDTRIGCTYLYDCTFKLKFGW